MATVPTIIHQRVEQCRAGTYPLTIGRVSSGWVVLGDVQFLRGYSLIYPVPVVSHLNELDMDRRKTLMHEVSVVGDALLELTGAVRINYEILGNLAPALHVHIFPRFDDEPEELRTMPVWFYDWDNAPRFNPARDLSLMADIHAYLRKTGILLETPQS